MKYIKTYKDRKTGEIKEEEAKCLKGLDIVDHHFDDDEKYDWYCDCMIFNFFYNESIKHYCPSGSHPCGRERFELLSIREKDSDRYLYINKSEK